MNQAAHRRDDLIEHQLRELLPEADDFPESIPPDIFEMALQTYAQCEKLDMRALAEKLGIARRTLYRKIGDRNQLMGEIHWYFSRVFYCQGFRNSASLKGAARIVAVYEHFIQEANNSPPLVKVLKDEPENTLRIITTKHGPVHGRVLSFLHRLLQWEQDQGHFSSSLPLDALAFAIVRIGESFLYAEILSGDQTDVMFSVEMISRLLRPDQIKSAK